MHHLGDAVGAQDAAAVVAVVLPPVRRVGRLALGAGSSGSLSSLERGPGGLLGQISKWDSRSSTEDALCKQAPHITVLPLLASIL